MLAPATHEWGVSSMNRRFRSSLAAVALLAAACLVPSATSLAAPPEPAAASAEPAPDKEAPWSDWVRDWRPALRLQYGFTEVSRQDFGGSFGPAGLLDLQVGSVRERGWAGEPNLLTESAQGLVVGRIASGLAGSDRGADEVGIDAWRFGFGSAGGSGYRLGSGDRRLVFLTGRTGAWYFTDLELPTSPHLATADSLFLARYDDATPFGDAWEGSVRFCVSRPLSVQLSYERAVVLPGFKIWYYLLSNGIDVVAIAIADRFVEAIADSSPQAAPVVSFLLRSAIQYGFYELRQDQVNWPFDTEAPLAFDSFKLGFSVVF